MIRKLKNRYHALVATSANVYTRFPSRKLKVIGVTGTDGKTTTSSIVYQILKNSGRRTALISTVGAFIGDKEFDVGFHVTTPSSFALQKYIKKAAQEGCEYLVLEITSHGLDQSRDLGIKYDIGVITNVTHEHLDYHKTYENYVKAKVRLLERSQVCIINRDDESYEYISKLKSQNSKLKEKKWVTFGLKENSDVNLKNFPFETNLIGDFNKHNSLAAAAVTRVIGVEDESIRKTLKHIEKPRGRQDIVYDKNFKVIIDFAHTPNSLEQILPGVKEQTKGRLIHVFGSAGKRDATKRPLMGAASVKSSDIIILTAEDPRTESIESIINDIASGIKSQKIDVRKINDRKKAIFEAIAEAKKGDTIIVTGKGHEKSMNYGNGEEPWDEYAVVEEALKKRIKNNE